MLSFSPPNVDLEPPRAPSAAWIGTADAVRARRRYRFTHTSTVIGSGANQFDAARQAMERWEMAHQGWVHVEPEQPPIERGTQVAIISKVGPLWVAAIGLVTTVEQSSDRFAFTYGTTKQHVLKGEERFAVDLHGNGDVVFSLTAVSRPARWWGWLGYPLLRWFQARFQRGAVKAMKKALG